jgi:hypothetical protein
MKYLRVTMPDGSRWDIPVNTIARNRAENYKDEFDGDIERSLKEDTLPLFAEDEYEIKDWAANNMDWDDVREVAIPAPPKPTAKADYQEGWMNGEKKIVTRTSQRDYGSEKEGGE